MNRHPLALAWDRWCEDNPKSLDVTTLRAPSSQRQYLENRLNRAFNDGAAAQKNMEYAPSTPTNTGSPKLIALADRAIAQLETMSLHQALDTVKELRNQLQAGAVV